MSVMSGEALKKIKFYFVSAWENAIIKMMSVGKEKT